VRAERIRTVSIWSCVAAGVVAASWSLQQMAWYIRDDCQSENNEGSYIALAVVAFAISSFWILGRNWLRTRKTWVFVVAVLLSIFLALCISVLVMSLNYFEFWHGCEDMY
jgi:hypothetical protein